MIEVKNLQVIVDLFKSDEDKIKFADEYNRVFNEHKILNKNFKIEFYIRQLDSAKLIEKVGDLELPMNIRSLLMAIHLTKVFDIESRLTKTDLELGNDNLKESKLGHLVISTEFDDEDRKINIGIHLYYNGEEVDVDKVHAMKKFVMERKRNFKL